MTQRLVCSHSKKREKDILAFVVVPLDSRWLVPRPIPYDLREVWNTAPHTLTCVREQSFFLFKSCPLGVLSGCCPSDQQLHTCFKMFGRHIWRETQID